MNRLSCSIDLGAEFRKAPKKKKITNKIHDVPGLMLSNPLVDPFKVTDGHGNWKIERPLFRWGRMNKSQADDEAKMLNVGYQIAMLDLLAKRPEALKNLKALKKMKDDIENKFKGFDFDA